MLTSLEIAQLLKAQNKSKKTKSGFDTALVGLGIGVNIRKQKRQKK